MTAPYVVEPGSGTSYATAVVAGACALWLAYHGRKRLIKKYDAGRLTSVFREILVTRGFEKPPGWETNQYGAGILRADRLLEAPLPATPPASGLAPMALRRPQRPAGNIERIADTFPDMDKAEIRRALERLLQARPEDLEEVLEKHGDELTVHLATNPDLRSSVLDASRPRAKATTRSRLSKNQGLLRNASKSLRRQMSLIQ
jgi:thermitase